MRRCRRLLSSEIYFVTIRTVEERFALEPYACPGAWLEAEDERLDFDAKQGMLERGRACVKATADLTEAIARAEQDAKQPRPEVPYDMFTDSIPNIIGSCMARGIQMFGVHLYGFVWMSNHGHLLLRAPKANFADFMAYLNGQIAVNVNRFLGRKHQLWARRYAASQVLDEAAELQMLGYLLANPQNAGIANSIDEWPGLSSGTSFFEDIKQRFLCFDRTRWYKGGRPNNIAPYLSTVVLKHMMLPQLSMFDVKELRRKLRSLIKGQVKPLDLVDTKVDIDPVLPVRRQLLARTVIPTDRPESSKSNPRKRSPQPLCHTTKPSLRKLYKAWYREFCVAYQNSSREYRLGDTDTEFPPGSFAPSKYPRARYARDPDARATLHPTRRNLEMADALLSLAA
jgi:REP element-mobilizing transposase RayT